MPGIKHLIECHCYLKIYKKENTFINHKFLVYSKVNEFDKKMQNTQSDLLRYAYNANSKEQFLENYDKSQRLYYDNYKDSYEDLMNSYDFEWLENFYKEKYA